MDDLIRIKGIGQTTAKKLAEAGFATPEALANADPDAPITGVKPDDWKAWIEAAKALPAAPPDGDEETGPECRERVRYRGKIYETGRHLPADIEDDVAGELKRLGAID